MVAVELFYNATLHNIVLCIKWKAFHKAFRALKTSGFNIEDTHLTDIERINKLFAPVLVAFIWSYKIGVFLNDIYPIKIKKHGRRTKSLFKYGLTHLSNVLFSNDINEFAYCCKFLSCT
jgi:hypothetical protein